MKHVTLYDTICITTLSCADCHWVYCLKLLLAQRDVTYQTMYIVHDDDDR
jgi:hypothetical protein